MALPLFNTDTPVINTVMNPIIEKVNENEMKIGDLSTLTTTEKTNLVGATNELNSAIGQNTHDISQLSNPNLIINPDFRINQRGQAEYTFNVNSGCSVDRWVADPNFGIIKVIPNDGFLRLEQISIGTGDGFHAVKETIESSKNLSGKKVTLSCEYRNKAGSSQGMILFFSGNGVILQKPLPHSENWTKAQLTVELPQLTSDIAVLIYSDISKSLGYTDYRYVKLELGEIATPLSPRPYGEELALCQRYYQIRSVNNITSVDLRPMMRINPTIGGVVGAYTYDAEIY